ncbi:Protein AIR2 [Ophiocordyceps camponoti-floridani]|uniref:Protein AIR2 n=1 Tax=Ophiocordyceps camponoti-floridani TaxID=2030778 RepID=A0A8H4Q3F4_9HYPO|nr:Protein AIR2 [Ophiocordyceps camponoti-floridani]
MSQQGKDPNDAIVIYSSDEEQPEQGTKRAHDNIEAALDMGNSPTIEDDASLSDATVKAEADDDCGMPSMPKKQRTETDKEAGLEGGSVEEADKPSPLRLWRPRRAMATSRDPDKLVRPDPDIEMPLAPGHDGGQPPASDEQQTETAEDDGLQGMSVLEAYQASASDHLLRPAPGILRPLHPRTLLVDSLELVLPGFDLDTNGPWQSRFVYWVRILCSFNSGVATSMTPHTALVAFENYVEYHTALSLYQKHKARQRAGGVVYEFGSNVASAMEMVATAWVVLKLTPDETAEKSSGATTARVASRPANDNALATPTRRHVLHAYAKMAKDRQKLTCLNCSREGHEVVGCTFETCKFCSGGNHWHYACPTRRRCSKCRQLGHLADHCEGEWAVSQTRGLKCAFCESDHHLEGNCPEPWLKLEAITRRMGRVMVIHTPIMCALCGARDHFWSDCPTREETANDDGQYMMEAQWAAARDAVAPLHYRANTDSKMDVDGGEMHPGPNRHVGAGGNQAGPRHATTTDAMPRVSFEFRPQEGRGGRHPTRGRGGWRRAFGGGRGRDDGDRRDAAL